MKISNTVADSGISKLFDLTKYQLVVAVLVIFLALAYLLYSGYGDVKNTYNRTVETIVEQQQKQQLLTSMANVARDRSLILLKMLAEDDAFELDELNQEFAQQARNYISSRQKLISLQLNDVEKELLAKQDALASVNQKLQRKIADLFMQGEREQAKKLLFELAIPGQNRVLRQINLTIDEYNKKTLLFIDDVKKGFQYSSRNFLLLGGLLLFASIVVVGVIMTRVSRQDERKLKQALDDLAEQKHALDAHAIVSITDLDGNISYVNSRFCECSGYGQEELLGQNQRMLKSSQHDDAFFAEMYRVISAGEIWRGEICNTGKDGYDYWLETTIVPFMDEHGKPQSYITMCSDITVRKLTEKALRRTQKMEAVGELTGGIAHDFNNILGVVLGHLSLLERQLVADEKVTKRLATITKATQRAVDLTRQLLGFSRKQAETVEVTDINQKIDEMESLIGRSVTPQVEVTRELAEELWMTEIDSGDLQDALLNLIINARDAMESRGHLFLKTANITLDKQFCTINPGAVPGDYVLLQVGDSGRGIDVELQDRIFEPFFTTKPQGAGTGLGLAMVFGFVKRSGGYIKVCSELGSGTTFQLYLPRMVGMKKPAVTHNHEQSIPLVGGTETLLVVDDEEGLLELACESLQAQGYRVLTANNGRQALQILAQEPEISLLFSDIVMPGGVNGYELAEQATAKRPGLKVLLTSGYAVKAMADKGQVGFDATLLSKPYSQDEMVRWVREMLG